MPHHHISPGKQQVHIRAIAHRGREVWLVTFPYSAELYNRCKTIGGHYTRTHKGWWWPTGEMTVGQLRKKLGVSTFSQDQKKAIGKATAGKHDKIPSETGKKILKMERWMQQKRYSASTIATYESFVRQFFASQPELSWNGITADLITRYNHGQFIAKKKSYSTQNQWINAIKVYLKVHGLDVGELADIDSGEGLIYIRGGKGAKDRRVPLSARVLTELRKYYSAYQPKEFLFEGQKGGKYSNTSAAKVFKRAVREAGIRKRVTLHTLRHSYATHLTNRGVNIQYLQEILGHNSPKTTMLYTHLSGKDIKDIKSPLDDMEI